MVKPQFPNYPVKCRHLPTGHRSLITVLKAIYEKVPEDFPHNDDLLARMNGIIQTYLYTAPETLSYPWELATNLLVDYFNDTDQPWVDEIKHIFNNTISAA